MDASVKMNPHPKKIHQKSSDAPTSCVTIKYTAEANFTVAPTSPMRWLGSSNTSDTQLESTAVSWTPRGYFSFFLFHTTSSRQFSYTSEQTVRLASCFQRWHQSRKVVTRHFTFMSMLIRQASLVLGWRYRLLDNAKLHNFNKLIAAWTCGNQPRRPTGSKGQWKKR